ncbi:MAG: hypothetical protein PHI15_03825 [Methanomicrobium sp.]|nr:hypothetical protein [Methanomicrobium sp.]
MDIIEQGFEKILAEIEEQKSKKEEFSKEILAEKTALLERMGQKAAPLAKTLGINILVQAKIDAHGELFEKVFTDKKMFILGKTEPMPYRPDDMTKKVDNQFCVLSEDGRFYEIMYSNTETRTDAYTQEIKPKEALDIYGTEIIFMLYKAFQQYLTEERELVSALEKTIVFIFSDKKE